MRLPGFFLYIPNQTSQSPWRWLCFVESRQIPAPQICDTFLVLKLMCCPSVKTNSELSIFAVSWFCSIYSKSPCPRMIVPGVFGKIPSNTYDILIGSLSLRYLSGPQLTFCPFLKDKPESLDVCGFLVLFYIQNRCFAEFIAPGVIGQIPSNTCTSNLRYLSGPQTHALSFSQNTAV